MRSSEIRFGPIYRGRDVHETPEGSSYNLTNVYRTKSGSIRKRPGYDLFKDYAAARYITKLWANPLDNTTNGIIVARNGAASDQIIDTCVLMEQSLLLSTPRVQTYRTTRTPVSSASQP